LQALEASMEQLGLSLRGAKRDLAEGKLRAVDRRAIEATKRALAVRWQLSAANA
jgi:hypothetical protein